MVSINLINVGYVCSSLVCECPEGFRCPSSGLTAPIVCSRGFYTIGRKNIACLTCLLGNYCEKDGTDVAQMKPCTAGNKCSAGSYSPEPCDYDTYQDLTGQSTCKICPVGKECLYRGTDVPKDCSPGYICLHINGVYSRQPCPAGFYCPAGTPFSAVSLT